MALIEARNSDTRRYEVRTAGKSIRLYTDGVFHSQWNKNRPLGGHIWDLLFLPILFHENPFNLKSVLILGAGGGTVINLINTFLKVKHIEGVDLDSVHLQLAKKYFIEKKSNLSLIRNDARKVVLEMEPRSHEIIVEDLFCGEKNDPSVAVRAVEASPAWLAGLSNCLTEDGVLVMNFESKRQLRGALNKKMTNDLGFRQLYCLTTPRYENGIAVLLKKNTPREAFLKNLNMLVQRRAKKDYAALNFSLTKIF